MIEQDMQNLTAAITALTAAIVAASGAKPKAEKAAAESPSPTGQSAATQPDTTAAPATAAPDTAAASAPASGATVDVEQQKNEIRSLAVKISTDVGPTVFVDVLGRYGIKTMKDYPVAKYGELIDHLKRVLAEGVGAV